MTTITRTRLGMKIKALRRGCHLTQAALAKKLGVHRVYVAQLEGGARTPSLAMLEKLARVLKVSVSELLE